MKPLRFLVFGVLSLSLLFAPRADAAPFDIIYVSDMDVTLCGGCGIVPGYSFALLVNTGANPITQAEIQQMTMYALTSEPGITLDPIPGNLYLFAPILPNEALGTVVAANTLLLSQLHPNEVFRSTSPYQVLTFLLDRGEGNAYEGEVVFNVFMQLGDDIVQFPIHADLTLGEHSITFVEAARVSSSGPTAIEGTTWGNVKGLFR